VIAPEPAAWRVQLGLLGFALGALRRRGSRALAVAGGLVASVALLSGVLFLTGALRGEAGQARRYAPDLVVQRQVGGRPALVDASLAPRIAAMPGVARVAARSWGYVFLPALQTNVAVVGALPGDASLPAVALGEGRAPGPDERGACLVGRELLAALGLRVGDRIRFPAPDDRGPTCRVTGTFTARVSLFTADVVLTGEADARAMLGLPAGQATDLAVTLTNPDESSVLTGMIVGLFPGARVLEKRLLERVHALSFGRRAGLVLGASLPALLVLLVLAQDRASGLGAAERREIAILKAAGWSSADVLAARLYEALLIGLGATAAGLLLGYGWVFALGAPGLREALAGWSSLSPAFALTPEVTAGQLFAVLGLVTAPYVALSVAPAWRASNLDPLDALREG
jgi:ABC-type lipoprotein release transport system permease subunit